MDDIQYGNLYSVYSWPNTVLVTSLIYQHIFIFLFDEALMGGFLLDRVFGIRMGAIIFCTLVAMGMCLFSIGVSLGNYWIAVVGRFVFGFEFKKIIFIFLVWVGKVFLVFYFMSFYSFLVSQSTYTSKWFKGKELAFGKFFFYFVVTVIFY